MEAAPRSYRCAVPSTYSAVPQQPNRLVFRPGKNGCSHSGCVTVSRSPLHIRDRELWPGVTKQESAEYWRAVAELCTKLDRLARSVGDLLDIVAWLETKKASLRVLCMSGTHVLDTGTATGRLMLAVIGAVGQRSPRPWLGRQREGIAKARHTGVRQRSAERYPAEVGGRQGLSDRPHTGDWLGKCLSGAGEQIASERQEAARPKNLRGKVAGSASSNRTHA